MAIHVITRNRELRQALLSLAAQRATPGNAHTVGGFEAFPPGDMVISTVRDCSLTACAILARRGVVVVVLSALPRPGESMRYLAAGAAAHVPMDLLDPQLGMVLDRLLTAGDQNAAPEPNEPGAVTRDSLGREGDSAITCTG